LPDDLDRRLADRLRPIFGLINSGVLAISVVALVQFASLGSSVEFPLNLSVYCFAICTPLAGMQAVMLNIESRVPEGVKNQLGYRVHAVLAIFTILPFYAGTLYMCAYFSLGTGVAFLVASAVVYALLVYMLISGERPVFYAVVFLILVILYSGGLLYFPYLVHDVLSACEHFGN
jgi:hypothetical protein